MKTNAPYLVVCIDEQLFALDCAIVQGLTIVPTVAAVPNLPADVRGVINLRGQVLPVVDMRSRLGYATMAERKASLIQLLHDREDDHVRWLAELEACVESGERFTGQLDPHQCAFGRWYDTFESCNQVLNSLLKHFDAPHREIHAVGARCVELVGAGRLDDARRLIATTRSGTLARLQAVFAETRAEVERAAREIAVVVDHGAGRMALLVDEGEAVEALEPMPGGTVQDDAGGCRADVVDCVARSRREERLVLVLKTDAESAIWS